MKRPRILIVDDSKPILYLLQVILKKNFDVYAANDGFDAMNWLIEGNHPDIIISDLQMPNINGMELLSYLSNSKFYETIPIIILSGSNRSEISMDCGSIKIAAYVSKPFDPADLLEKIDKALKENEQRRSPITPYQLS